MPHLDDRPADDALIASLLAKIQGSLTAHDIAFETHPEDTDVVRLLEAQAAKGDELSFYYVNLAAIVRKYEEWVRWLPRVKPCYAVKCNPDAVVVRCLDTIGTGYDCASIGEMQQILNLGVAPERIIYANPCKQKSGIEFARDHHILRMTFDNIAELRKIYSIYPEAELVVRIKPPTEQSVMSFSRKFGASTASAISLVNEAAKIGAKIVGVSFHVGSGCYDVSAYTMTLDQARKVFDAAESVGMKMTLLDIGGGFPGTDGTDGSLDIPPISFPEIAATVGPYIDKLFPESVSVISEPGRYFVAESTVLCASVLGRRNRQEESDPSSAESSPIASEESQFLYYIADGIYGSFNATIFDHMVVRPHVLPSTHRLPLSLTHTSTCFGPTCDSMDVVCRNIVLPELEIGDWLYFHNMGAYTRASGSTFNGIPLPVVHYYIS